MRRSVLVSLLLVSAVSALQAQAPPAPIRCTPVSERTGNTGCWIIASAPWSGDTTVPVYWSIDRFATMDAAQAAAGLHGQAVRALDQFWVLTISAKDDRPSSGDHVTQIGPLPLKPHARYTAQYMEAVLTPGTETVIHRHPGVEVFYTDSGESCLETPAGKRIGRKGEDVVVDEGEPMVLVASGTQNRRALTLVLHDADHAWSTPAPDWKPLGLCRH